ncbi:3,4-dihydroxy-2-butanone-4-phosphate synthase [Nocardia africana]
MTTQFIDGPDTAAVRLRRAGAAMASGSPVVLVDDRTTALDGYLIMAAEAATTSKVAFFITHSSGLLCVALPAADCDRLAIPAMAGAATDSGTFDACVAVDAASGTSTGISAHDRARTAALLADSASSADDFTRPGHVIPVRTSPDGVLRRNNIAEAASAVAASAGCRPVALFAALVSQQRPTGVAQGAELVAFAESHRLVTISISDVIAYRMSVDPLVSRLATARLPLRAGATRMLGYRSSIDGAEHVAVITGEPADAENVPVYVHQECLTGDVFGSLECRCRQRLERAVATIAAAGCGVVIYLRCPEGNTQCDPVQQTHQRDRSLSYVAANIVQEVGVRSVCLLEDIAEDRTAFQDRGMPTFMHELAVAAIA